MNNICPVCGYPDLHDPPEKPRGGPSFEICPSCGFQFGFTDEDKGFTYEQWRQRWVNGGMKWRAISFPAPNDWNPQEQLKNVEKT